MKTGSLTIWVMVAVFLFSGDWAVADCPSADRTGDCFVDFEDFALIGAGWPNSYDWNDVNTLANQWLTTDPCVPDDMVYIPDGNFVMGDHFSPEGYDDELPLHDVLLDAFFMSKFEITNQPYCDYLNSAYPAQIKVDSGVVYASSDDSNDYPYCDTHSYDSESQIDYNDASGTFSVRTKGEPPRDMSDDPMMLVSWYGAVAYCSWRSQQEEKEQCYDLSTWACDFNKRGYRLPTEAEWEYAARGGEHSPYYRFPWGDTISHSQANYYSYWSGGSPYYPYDVSPTEGYHPTWNDGIRPYTSPVGSFSANGYGLYDMTGNAWEWCNDWYSSTYYGSSPPNNPTGPTSGCCCVVRGGNWFINAVICRVASRGNWAPHAHLNSIGFRIVLDLE
jgi:formylglycine-generating enzyme required for sulfatase activity